MDNNFFRRMFSFALHLTLKFISDIFYLILGSNSALILALTRSVSLNSCLVKSPFLKCLYFWLRNANMLILTVRNLTLCTVSKKKTNLCVNLLLKYKCRSTEHELKAQPGLLLSCDACGQSESVCFNCASLVGICSLSSTE